MFNEYSIQSDWLVSHTGWISLCRCFGFTPPLKRGQYVFLCFFLGLLQEESEGRPVWTGLSEMYLDVVVSQKLKINRSQSFHQSCSEGCLSHSRFYHERVCLSNERCPSCCLCVSDSGGKLPGSDRSSDEREDSRRGSQGAEGCRPEGGRRAEAAAA